MSYIVTNFAREICGVGRTRRSAIEDAVATVRTTTGVAPVGLRKKLSVQHDTLPGCPRPRGPIVQRWHVVPCTSELEKKIRKEGKDINYRLTKAGAE